MSEKVTRWLEGLNLAEFARVFVEQQIEFGDLHELNDADLRELGKYPWVWTDEHCPFYGVGENLFKETGLEPTKAVIVDQESAIYRLVSEGVGLSLMPEVKAREAADKGILCISDILVEKIDLSLIYLKSRSQDPIITSIIKVVEKVWKKNLQANKNNLEAAFSPQ